MVLHTRREPHLRRDPIVTRILLAEIRRASTAFVTKGTAGQRMHGHPHRGRHRALDLVQTQDFDLLILDIGLPGMDGFEVLNTLRGTGSGADPHPHRARDSVRDRVAGLDGGADDYMAKPFSFDELLARVRRRIRTRRNLRRRPCPPARSDWT